VIDPIPILVDYENPKLLKKFGNIRFSPRAMITVDVPTKGKYNISYEQPITEDTKEVWVKTPEKKIELQKNGVTLPIIVLTENEELLPFCMKDRLASLQDKLNKNELNV